MIIKEPNYKKTHPFAYNKGYLKGEQSYENGYSRENVSNYAKRYANKSFTEELEQYAFLYGMIDGYNDARSADYKTL